MKKFYAITFTIISAYALKVNAQNIAINTSGNPAADCAILDVSSSTLGVLVPRISIGASGTYGLSGTAANANGLLVYNTNAGITGTGANGVGYYYWTTSVNRWINLLDNLPSGAWYLAGNAGTTAGTDFLGTTDAQDVVFKRNSSEVMRLYSASNYVGIGTTAPSNKLQVFSSSTAAGAANIWSEHTAAQGAAIFGLNNSTSNGYDGAIKGTTAYSGTIYFAGGMIGVFGASSGTGYGTAGTTSSTNTGSYGMYAQSPYSNSAGYYGLYVSGRAIATGNWYIPSDERLKKNINPLQNALDKILKLQAVEYDFNEEYSDFVSSTERQVGFLAQDVEKIFPGTSLVSSCTLTSKINPSSNSVSASASKKFEAKTVAYSGFIPYLVQAMQEQQKMMEELKKQNENLQKQIDELKNK